jgi:hypothetical protein
VSGVVYLGRPAFDPKPYTRIDPVARAEGGAWRVYADWSKALPSEGRAFAPRLPGFSSGSLLAFDVEPNAKNTQERDQFVVTNTWTVCEVLDFRTADAESARRQLVEVGLTRLQSVADHVIAALAGGICVAVKMVRHPSKDLWVANIDGLDHLETYALDEDLFLGDQVDGRWVTVPGRTLGTVTGAVNWCRDSDFLASVLKRLRKAAPHAPGTPTRAQISQIVAQLDRSDLLPNAASELSGMRERLRAFTPTLGANIRALDEIVETLAALTPVRDRLAAEVSARRAELESEMRQELEAKLIQELDASFAELTRERDRLVGEVSTAATDLEAARTELEEERVALEEARSTIGGELTRLLAELGDAPLEGDRKIATLRRRLAEKLGEPGAVFEVAAGGGPPWTTPNLTPGDYQPWDELEQVLEATARRWGYSSDDLRLADVASRGGRLVVMPDDTAARFVACYADVIGGGGFARHVLDPSVISLDDLWVLPGSGRHGCLARAWAAARLDRARFQVVLLDGLHRSPTALWLTSFLEVLQDPRRPRNLLTFASLGAPSVDPNRAWRGPSDEVAALAPTMTEGVPPGLLSRFAGGARRSARFNALDAPAPSSADVMAFVAALEEKASARVLEVACTVHRAAWGLGAERAARLARSAAGLGDEADGLSAGAAWLRERLENKD